MEAAREGSGAGEVGADRVDEDADDDGGGG